MSRSATRRTRTSSRTSTSTSASTRASPSSDPTEPVRLAPCCVLATLRRHDRLTLCCPHSSAGKSTLIKLLVGDLDPLSGNAVRNGRLRIAFFAQHVRPGTLRSSSPPLSLTPGRLPLVRLRTARRLARPDAVARRVPQRQVPRPGRAGVPPAPRRVRHHRPNGPAENRHAVRCVPPPSPARLARALTPTDARRPFLPPPRRRTEESSRVCRPQHAEAAHHPARRGAPPPACSLIDRCSATALTLCLRSRSRQTTSISRESTPSWPPSRRGTAASSSSRTTRASSRRSPRSSGSATRAASRRCVLGPSSCLASSPCMS